MAQSSWNLINKLLQSNPAMAQDAVAEMLAQTQSNQSLDAAAQNLPPSQDTVARAAGVEPMPTVDPMIAMPRPVDKPSDVLVAQLLKQQMEGYDKLQKDLESQRGGIDSQEARLAKLLEYNAPQRDITGTLMALDAISGKNQASVYKKPENYSKAVEDYIGLEDKLQQRRKDLTNTEADLLKQKLATKLTDADKKDERQMRSMNLKMEDTLRKDIDKDIAKPLNEYEQKVTPLEEVVKNGKISEIRSMATNFARVISGEKGVVTDADANRAIAQTWADNYSNFISKALNMTDEELASPATRKIMQEMIDTGKKSMGGALEKRLQDKETSYKTSSNYSPFFSEGAVGDSIVKSQRKRIADMMGSSSSVAGKKSVVEEMKRRGLIK